MAALCAMSAIIVSTSVDAAQSLPKNSAPSKNAGLQKMQYDVYAGGFHVVSAELVVDMQKKTNYFIRLNAKTHGMLARLAPWDGFFESKGWYDAQKGLPRPEIHRSSSTFRGEGELKEYRYKKDGSFAGYSVKDKDNAGEPKDVDPVLTQGTTDAFSAALQVMEKIVREGKCEGSDEVFDGKRRFKQIFAHKQNVDLKANDYNIYAGPAVECTVEVKQGAGHWHEKPRGWMSIQEQGRAKGTMPTIWFAQMAQGQPAVPVKIQVKTDYGTLFMHLTGYEGDGKTVSLRKK